MSERNGSGKTASVRISLDLALIDEMVDLLLRLEAVPECPTEELFRLLVGMLDEGSLGSRLTATRAGDDGVVLHFVGVFELYAAALRALDRHFRHCGILGAV
nr:hypothetical protein [Alcanivorax xiamenensis]